MEGQINVTVERRNFRKRKQQLGETFDDFLCSLRELAKTCQFCDDDCTQNNIRDQIIEALNDPDTAQELLKEQPLTLPVTITTCRGTEAAKKEVNNIKGASVQRISGHRKTEVTNKSKKHTRQQPSSSSNMNNMQNYSPQSQRKCPGCGKAHIKGDAGTVPPSRPTVDHVGRLAITRLCAIRNRTTADKASVHALKFNRGDRLWSINAVTAEPPAPTVLLHARALNGKADIDVLLDSGANICAAGTQFLAKLGEHKDNLDHSDIEPQAVNGNTMKTLGYLSFRFLTSGRSSKEAVHIYTGIRGALILWKAAIRLGILPECYPNPQPYPDARQGLRHPQSDQGGPDRGISYRFRRPDPHNARRKV